MIRRGIFVAPGGKLYLSLAHTAADVDQTLEAAEQALQAIQPALSR
jgi:glutamate-1-semialdehyde aminotransferase